MSTDPHPQNWRALAVVTTCAREAYLRRCLPRIAEASVLDPRISVAVSLDGDDPASREFCATWDVPLLHSDTREGVGLSKNRALEFFPDFDYYFFIEDDVEMLDPRVFAIHVEISQALGLHHMSLFERAGIRQPISETHVADQTVVHARYGGAQFNFFTAEGLRTVGGWHPAFAQYRRWGHTEHSYRFSRNHLAPAPFNVAVSLSDRCIVHSPPSVTSVVNAVLDQDQISAPERELMDLELTYVPLQTLAPYHFNEKPLQPLHRLAAGGSGRRYALLNGEERRHALSEYLISRSEGRGTLLERALSLGAGVAMAPLSPAAKHAIKTRLLR